MTTASDFLAEYLPAPAQSVPMVGVLRAARAYGPYGVILDSVEPPAVQLVVVDRSAIGSPVASIDAAFAKKFQKSVTNAGSGQFSLLNDDTDIGYLDVEHLVHVYLRGRLWMSMLIEGTDQTTLTEGEEVDQLTSFVGREHIAISEEAVVYPPNGLAASPVVDDVTFNWTSPYFVDSAWVSATEIVAQNVASGLWGGSIDGRFYPFDWFDGSAIWLWDSSGNQTTAPVGVCYFRRSLTFTTSGWYRFEFAGSFYGDLWFDTVHQGSVHTGGMNTFFYVSAGVHQLAMVGQATGETIDPNPAYHPGGVIWSIAHCDENGIASTVVFRSDANTLILPYAPQPGMTIGRIIRAVVEAAQARGAVLEIDYSFSDDYDTYGNAWVPQIIVSTKVGTDLLTFFMDELAQTYADIWITPGTWTLNACAKGGRGRASGITYAPTTDPDTSNVTSLHHKKIV